MTEALENTFGRVVVMAQRLGRVQALQGLVDGIQAGGDPLTLIEGMLAYEKIAEAAEADRRARQQ